MPLFDYKAINKEGNEISGQMEGASVNEVLGKIKQKELYPVEVISEDDKKEKKKFSNFLSEKLSLNFYRAEKFDKKDIVIFTRQVSVLLDAGLPLLRCLYTLQKQNKFESSKKIIGGIAGIIESGKTFSEALAHYPGIFSKVYINMVKAGETGGALDEVLRKLADYLEKDLKLTQRIKAAFMYPSLVLFMALCILGFLISFVIPRFMELFKNSGIALPFLTTILLNISNFLRIYWYAFPVFFIILAFVYQALRKNDKFRYSMDKFMLNLPVFGPLIQKLIASRFSRTLSTLINGGVSILMALELTKDISGNEVVTHVIDDVYENVREGGFIAKVLDNSEIFPQLMVNMIAVGEESGSLDKMLLKVADAFEEEVEIMTNALTSLLEPVLIICLGVIVGLIILSMFLPLVSLIQSLSQ